MLDIKNALVENTKQKKKQQQKKQPTLGIATVKTVGFIIIIIIIILFVCLFVNPNVSSLESNFCMDVLSV